MARGKHAAQAARQRYEATLVVVDRLNEKTSELKIRTRQVEALAKETGPLRKRVAELERQLAGEETARMALLRASHEEQVAELEDKLMFAAAVFNNVFSAAMTAVDDDLMEALMDAMDQTIGGDIRFTQLVSDFGFMSLSELNRSRRRKMHKVRWASDKQDNMQSQSDNKLNKFRRQGRSLGQHGDTASDSDDWEWYCLACDTLGVVCATCSAIAQAQA
jgi:hypothetical protein